MTATIPSPNWTGATALVQAAKRILIVTHVNPDGDAIGSMLGLGNALMQMGKSVDMAVEDGVPNYLKFLPNSEKVYAKLTTSKWDVLISVDASDEERSGSVGAYGRHHCAQVINLDHHVSNTGFGNVQLVMPDAVSATEVVYHWLGHMGITTLTPLVAVPLLTGLLTDTMGFRTSNVKAQTLGIAQALMDAGASLAEITARTLDSKPFNAVRLWARVLPSITLEDEVVCVQIQTSDFQELGLHDISDAGLVSLLNQIDEARAAVIFMEVHDNKVKLSFRCKLGYDVSAVAVALGGGGHKQAAGATVSGGLEEVRARVLPMLKQVVVEGHKNID